MSQPIDTDADRLRVDDALQILATCRRLVSDRRDAAAANFGEYAVTTQKWDRRLSALTKTRRLVEPAIPKLSILLIIATLVS